MDEVQVALQKRYPNLHPLLFQRSLEKAKSNGELFDLLESMPDQYPILWDDNERLWKRTDNLLQALIKDKEKDG
jgi:hypothetical protein